MVRKAGLKKKTEIKGEETRIKEGRRRIKEGAGSRSREMERRETAKIISIIPKDRFYNKRAKNLVKAEDKEVLYKNGEVAAVVFINRLFFLKFVTWITNERYRRKGYTSECLARIKKRHPLLFVKVQKGNIPSYMFAKKNGFKELFKTPGLFWIYPGTLFCWRKGGLRD